MNIESMALESSGMNEVYGEDLPEFGIKSVLEKLCDGWDGSPSYRWAWPFVWWPEQDERYLADQSGVFDKIDTFGDKTNALMERKLSHKMQIRIDEQLGKVVYCV